VTEKGPWVLVAIPKLLVAVYAKSLYNAFSSLQSPLFLATSPQRDFLCTIVTHI
jgi:hypothetical protein